MSKNILVVGCGNMGKALIKGLALSIPGPDQFTIYAHDRHDHLLEDLKDLPNVVPIKELEPVGRQDDAVIVCVKPQDLGRVARLFAGNVAPNAMIVSILAGVTMEDIRLAFQFEGPLVRAMPNIAATVGAAATAMSHNESCDSEHKALAETIFRGVGEAHWTREDLMDAVTGLSGSGPAYLYMVIEALTDGGVKMGIPRDLALKLSTQTVLGSAMLVKVTGLHPAILRDQVTTPGGTTISAIHELETHGLRSMLISAVATATARSAELSKKGKN